MAGAGMAVASRLLGVRMLTEHSDSMYPALTTGDLLLTHDIRADAARIGDIVTYPDPSRGGELLTHRVTAIRRSGDLLVFATRGDANRGEEMWTATPGATIGRTTRVIPGAGTLLAPLSRPAVAAAVNGVLVTVLVLLGATQLRGARPPGRRQPLRRRRSPGVPSPR